MKNILKISSYLILSSLFVIGCKTSKPYEGGEDVSSGEMEGDTTTATDVGNLPQRGDFNPDKDVDYSIFQAADMNCGVIYFATDSTTIQPSERAKLDKVSKWLSENSGKKILIAGHCDDRGTLEYNRALGERRAIAVRDYLVGLGVNSSRVYTHSYGEEKPAVDGSGEEIWSKNRRAEIGVVKQ